MCWVSNFASGTTIYYNFNINMYKLIEIRHNILIQCHGNYIMIKKYNYMLEIHLLKIPHIKNLGILRGASKGFVCPNDAQMPCWLRLCPIPFCMQIIPERIRSQSRPPLIHHTHQAQLSPPAKAKEFHYYSHQLQATSIDFPHQ